MKKPKKSALRVDPAGSSVPRQPYDKQAPRRRALGLEEHITGVRAADHSILGRAITLIESNRSQHRALAHDLLTRLMPDTGGSTRIGITGVPGAGKSTFIETLGVNLCEAGHHVAVLAVDPSSAISGGSILGDKTRMARLSTTPTAFIRPSPSAGTLGGVARKTRETMLLCEAAGFDIVLVETVGVGQSEATVAEMTDLFLALLISGAGDDLQGIKRGLIELTDLIAINKADGDNKEKAKRAAAQYAGALRYTRAPDPEWETPVLTCSALYNEGIEEIWEKITERRRQLDQSGRLRVKRRDQQLRWMWSMVEERLRESIRAAPAVNSILGSIESDVLAGRIPATLGAERILRAFERSV